MVQARLGHASATETLDTYSHLWPDSDDRTKAAVDAVLSFPHRSPGPRHRASAAKIRSIFPSHGEAQGGLWAVDLHLSVPGR